MDALRRVVVAGHICLDIIPDLSAIPAGQFDRLFQPGHLIEVGAATLSAGGAVSNTGLALHRLGIPTRLIGKVGDDPIGHEVLHIIGAQGADLVNAMVVDPQATTSYSIILSPPGADRTFLHCAGANHTFSAADVTDDHLGQADLLHFGYPPVMRRMYADGGRELIELMCRAKALGVTTSLDLCYPDPSSDAGQADWITIFQAALPCVDIFLPSIEELLFMLRRATFDRLAANGGVLEQVTPELLMSVADELVSMGVKVIVIKLGERGAYLRTASAATLQHLGRARPVNLSAWASQEMWAPCFKVNVAGTTGSGDATIAGFLSALLRDESPQMAMTMAVAVGACNVEAADALSGIRSWEETLARITQGWQRLPLRVDAPGWKWDTQFNLWQAT